MQGGGSCPRPCPPIRAAPPSPKLCWPTPSTSQPLPTALPRVVNPPTVPQCSPPPRFAPIWHPPTRAGPPLGSPLCLPRSCLCSQLALPHLGQRPLPRRQLCECPAARRLCQADHRLAPREAGAFWIMIARRLLASCTATHATAARPRLRLTHPRSPCTCARRCAWTSTTSVW